MARFWKPDSGQRRNKERAEHRHVSKKAGDKWAVSLLREKLQLLSNLGPQCAYYALIISGCKHLGGGSYSCWVLHTLVNH